MVGALVNCDIWLVTACECTEQLQRYGHDVVFPRRIGWISRNLTASVVHHRWIKSCAKAPNGRAS